MRRMDQTALVLELPPQWKAQGFSERGFFWNSAKLLQTVFYPNRRRQLPHFCSDARHSLSLSQSLLWISAGRMVSAYVELEAGVAFQSVALMASTRALETSSGGLGMNASVGGSAGVHSNTSGGGSSGGLAVRLEFSLREGTFYRQLA